MGWEVFRVNYLNDWGKFLSLLVVGWEKYGNEDALESNPTRHTIQVFQQIQDELVPEEQARKKLQDEVDKAVHDGHEAPVELTQKQAELEEHGLFAQRNAAFKKLE